MFMKHGVYAYFIHIFTCIHCALCR